MASKTETQISIAAMIVTIIAALIGGSYTMQAANTAVGAVEAKATLQKDQLLSLFVQEMQYSQTRFFDQLDARILDNDRGRSSLTFNPMFGSSLPLYAALLDDEHLRCLTKFYVSDVAMIPKEPDQNPIVGMNHSVQVEHLKNAILDTNSCIKLLNPEEVIVYSEYQKKVLEAADKELKNKKSS